MDTTNAHELKNAAVRAWENGDLELAKRLVREYRVLVPVQSDPVQPDPVQSDPVQPDPVQSDPVQSDPVQPTLIDIPFDIFLENILPLIDVKEVGSLSMVHPVLKELCDENIVWKVLYTRMVPPRIIDSSVHQLADPCMVVACQDQWYNKCKCMPRGLFKKIPCWLDVRLPGQPRQIYVNNYNFQRLPPDEQCLIQQAREYYAEHIRAFWIEYNRKKKLSTKNLCQCVEHYKVDTLQFDGPKVNYKCFKKMVLKKLIIQKKKEMRAPQNKHKAQEKKIEKYETYLAKLHKEKQGLCVVIQQKEKTLEKLSNAL